MARGARRLRRGERTRPVPAIGVRPGEGIDTEDLFAFIGATQAEAWDRLKQLHGGLPGAQTKFVVRLESEIDRRGTVGVLRHGVVDHGVTIRLAYFKPAYGLTPELMERYGANRLNVTRQLAYQAGSTKTIDLGLFVNGLLVATAELRWSASSNLLCTGCRPHSRPVLLSAVSPRTDRADIVVKSSASALRRRVGPTGWCALECLVSPLNRCRACG